MKFFNKYRLKFVDESTTIIILIIKTEIYQCFLHNGNIRLTGIFISNARYSCGRLGFDLVTKRKSFIRIYKPDYWIELWILFIVYSVFSASVGRILVLSKHIFLLKSHKFIAIIICEWHPVRVGLFQRVATYSSGHIGFSLLQLFWHSLSVR